MYEKNPAKTQKDWADTCETCKSVAENFQNQRQTPINIEEGYTKIMKMGLPTLNFKYALYIPNNTVNGKFKNNRNTIQFDKVQAPDTFAPATMCGGPLMGEYNFEQMHCHWGKANVKVNKAVKKGSEHWVGGKQ